MRRQICAGVSKLHPRVGLRKGSSWVTDLGLQEGEGREKGMRKEGIRGGSPASQSRPPKRENHSEKERAWQWAPFKRPGRRPREFEPEPCEPACPGPEAIGLTHAEISTNRSTKLLERVGGPSPAS